MTAFARPRKVIGARVAAALLGAAAAFSAPQGPAVRSVDEKTLREYAGAYQWEANAFLYLQMWSELTGKNQLVAFDESGEVRALYPIANDRFFAGRGAALANAIESTIDFQRDHAGKIISLVWGRDGAGPRIARRVSIERSEDINFSNGGINLAGTLRVPIRRGKHPAIILVHASGAEDRECLLPFARFLVRHGIAILGYDKRGVGGSTGDWNTASFDDLAGDAAAAFHYLKKRSDIEMTARGMRPAVIQQIIALMKLQYEFARSGRGWEAYAAAREQIATRIGRAPDTFPATTDHPYRCTLRRSATGSQNGSEAPAG